MAFNLFLFATQSFDQGQLCADSSLCKVAPRPRKQALVSDFDRQVAQAQDRIAMLNRYPGLGIPVTEPVGKVGPGGSSTSGLFLQNST